MIDNMFWIYLWRSGRPWPCSRHKEKKLSESERYYVDLEKVLIILDSFSVRCLFISTVFNKLGWNFHRDLLRVPAIMITNNWCENCCAQTWEVPRYSWSWRRGRWRGWCWWSLCWASHNWSDHVCPAWDWTGTDPCSSEDHWRGPPSTWTFYWTPAKIVFKENLLSFLRFCFYPKIWNEADKDNQEYQYDNQHYESHHSYETKSQYISHSWLLLDERTSFNVIFLHLPLRVGLLSLRSQSAGPSSQ